MSENVNTGYKMQYRLGVSIIILSLGIMFMINVAIRPIIETLLSQYTIPFKIFLYMLPTVTIIYGLYLMYDCQDS